MNEVDQESLDVRPIMVLISHDHDVSIAKGLGVFVLLAYLDAQYLDEVLYLRVVHDLLIIGFSNIQELSPQREHSKLISSYNLDAS